MTIAEYFETLTERLVLASWVADFKIIKRVDRSKNGHVRARVIFSDNSQGVLGEIEKRVKRA